MICRIIELIQEIFDDKHPVNVEHVQRILLKYFDNVQDHVCSKLFMIF